MRLGEFVRPRQSRGSSLSNSRWLGDWVGGCDINQNGQGRNNLGLGHVGGI